MILKIKLRVVRSLMIQVLIFGFGFGQAVIAQESSLDCKNWKPLKEIANKNKEKIFFKNKDSIVFFDTKNKNTFFKMQDQFLILKQTPKIVLTIVDPSQLSFKPLTSSSLSSAQFTKENFEAQSMAFLKDMLIGSWTLSNHGSTLTVLTENETLVCGAQQKCQNIKTSGELGSLSQGQRFQLQEFVKMSPEVCRALGDKNLIRESSQFLKSCSFQQSVTPQTLIQSKDVKLTCEGLQKLTASIKEFLKRNQ